jgi:hypothetical protein
MGTQNLIKLGGTPFKVLQAASLLIPEVVSSPSPTNGSSGVSPTSIFDAKKEGVGGMIFLGVSDEAGNGVTEINFPINPGDTVALSAVGSGKVTLTVTPKGGSAITVAVFAATAVAAVIGFYA